MGEADAEHTTRTPSEKISVNEAFHLLLAARLQPHVARHRLNEAMLTNEVRLWVNDPEGIMVVVDVNFIASSLRVAAQTEPDGRWIAYIAPTKALVPMKYIWEVARAEIEDLLGKTAEPKPELAIGAVATPAPPPEPAITKEELARRIIQDLYGRPPHEIPKSEAKTGTVCTKVNAELKRRADAEGRKNCEIIRRDTVDRAMRRGKRRNKKS